MISLELALFSLLVLYLTLGDSNLKEKVQYL